MASSHCNAEFRYQKVIEMNGLKRIKAFNHQNRCWIDSMPSAMVQQCNFNFIEELSSIQGKLVKFWCEGKSNESSQCWEIFKYKPPNCAQSDFARFLTDKSRGIPQNWAYHVTCLVKSTYNLVFSAIPRSCWVACYLNLTASITDWDIQSSDSITCF
jgi:hypothetical protein